MSKRNSKYYRRMRVVTLSTSAAMGTLQAPELGRELDPLSEVVDKDRGSNPELPQISIPIQLLTFPEQSLEAVLCSLSPLERTEMVCEWATSLAVEKRITIAEALASSVSVLGAATAIEHLSVDPSPEVRARAARAAWRRRPTMPAHYDQVLRGLFNDPMPEVREVARVLLGISRS